MTWHQAINIKKAFKNVAFIVLIALMTWSPSTAFAQGRTEFQSARRGIATVIFCGLGGALLGLSTLSFYGKPQDHTSNIYGGLGIGLVAGLSYVLMAPAESMARTSKPVRPQLAEFKDFDFNSSGRRPALAHQSLPLASYSWTF